MKALVAVSLGFLLSSCQQDDRVDWTPKTADVSTARERAFVQSVVEEVQDFSGFKGLDHDFRAVPIRIVERFSYDFGDADVGGICYPAPHSFIEIKRSVLRDPEEGWNIVVHELGHCVLKRAHDDEVMEGGSSSAMIRRGDAIYPAADLCVSVMSSRGNRMAPRSYYLQELFGEKRITRLKDLARSFPYTVFFF